MSSDTPRKRKADTKPPSSHPGKRPRGADEQSRGDAAAPKHALIAPHESIIAELSARCDVLAASVISSSRIGKRTAHITAHLLRPDDDHDGDIAAAAAENAAEREAGGGGDRDGGAEAKRPRVALLHARAADVCKMITVAELCKRTLGERGRAWYQYNQMFELPREAEGRLGGARKDMKRDRRKRGEEEEEEREAQVEDEDEDSDEDAFEPPPSRFESAVLPPPRARTTMSLRIFLSLEPIPDLRSRVDVTIQSSREA